VVSVHGGDVYFTAPRHPAGERAVRRAFGAARLVLANSAGIEDEARRLGARATRVVRLGTDVPEQPAHKEVDPTLVTVAHLVARKRHADVVRALWLLRERHPQLRYLIVGDGPEREPLARLAGELGVADRVELTGQLPREEALARARAGHVFVMPSVDEAFGVAYVEAMAAGLPAVGARGEAGPQEIAAAGDGLRLVPPADVEALAAELDALLAEPAYLLELGARARATVCGAFTWELCGRATVQAYEDALR
jgi:teichuronic acid biosynthesis glycosyltransferase TuaC